MKKLALVFSMIVFVFGCQQHNDTTGIKQVQKSNHDDYQAIDTVIETHGNINNIDRFTEFVQHVESEQKDEIKLIRYTIEGDPIFYYLEYDGKTIRATIDTTMDKFGSGRITIMKCASMQAVETDKRTDYELVECENSSDRSILTIWRSDQANNGGAN